MSVCDCTCGWLVAFSAEDLSHARMCGVPSGNPTVTELIKARVNTDNKSERERGAELERMLHADQQACRAACEGFMS